MSKIYTSADQLIGKTPLLELSLMQRDGLLETYRSSFKIMDAEALRGMVL